MSAGILEQVTIGVAHVQQLRAADRAERRRPLGEVDLRRLRAYKDDRHIFLLNDDAGDVFLDRLKVLIMRQVIERGGELRDRRPRSCVMGRREPERAIAEIVRGGGRVEKDIPVCVHREEQARAVDGTQDRVPVEDDEIGSLRAVEDERWVVFQLNTFRFASLSP